MYQKNNLNQFTLVRTYDLGTATNDKVGNSVKVGKHHAFIGAPGANKVHIIPFAEIIADSVKASKGTTLNQTRIDWKIIGLENKIAGFRIYRDGTLIGSVGNQDRFFFDDNGVAGQRYIYEVAVYHSDMEQRRYPVEGWSKQNGVLEGDVVTLEGDGKVAGVQITANALVKENYYNLYRNH